MNPPLMIIIVFSLGAGTMTTFMSSHWLLAWMGLEINTLAFVPLMAKQHHPRAVEATTKYFLTQATAAAMLLFASASNAWATGQWNIQQMTHPLSSTLAVIALALKIGLAPVHSWLPEVLQGLDLTTGLIMSTWQKLAPFALLLQINPSNSTLLIILGITSTLVGGWGGLNQTQLRKILAYSSIAHLGWMLLVLQFSPSLTFLTLILYFVMTFSAFTLFKYNKATTINALSIAWTNAPALTALSPLLLLSLGGLPPLAGFMPKWLILQELAGQGLGLIATFAALTALLSLYFYLRLSYAMALTVSPNNVSSIPTWRLPSLQSTLPLATATVATLLLLPLMPAATALLAL
uniref:NADH-ubiquinone oxidoreductase chain 2 n=1 Tax=Parapercis sexfasciata TaxID=261519 RepID=A0A679EM37_9TELE|nr:NADH dehydrogenase subunit 2 [Parapercis sexfasciata]